MPDINIKFSADSNGTGTSSTDYLVSVLNKLSAAVDKLALKNGVDNSGLGSTSNFSRTSDTFKPASNVFSDAVNQFNLAGERAFKDLGNKIGSTLATAISAAVGISAIRTLGNNANAIMGRASISGNFIASAIAGNANSSFGGYISGLYDVERQRRIANVNALAEGAGGVIGAGIGGLGVLGAAVVAPETIPALIAGGASKIMAATGGIGIGAGQYEAASKYNQYTEAQFLALAATEKKAAEASVSQSMIGFSRFGFKMTNHEIVPPELNGGRGISVPLADAFNARYDNPRTQNFNSILNNIVPYMTRNPMDSSNGDLDKVAQTFRKAGFDVSEFSRLTMQSTQYMNITGKNFETFAGDIKDAREKFGYAYGLDANENAMKLMSYGLDRDTSQHLANQAIYNPGVNNGIQTLTSNSYSDYYVQKAISRIVGFDIPKSLAAGNMIGLDGKPASRELRNRYGGYLLEQARGNGTDMNLYYLQQARVDSNEVASIIQDQTAEGKNRKNKKSKDDDLLPYQEEANKAGPIQDLLAKVDNMTVNATKVIINSTDETGILSSIGNFFKNAQMTPYNGANLADNRMMRTLGSFPPLNHSAASSPAKR